MDFWNQEKKANTQVYLEIPVAEEKKCTNNI